MKNPLFVLVLATTTAIYSGGYADSFGDASWLGGQDRTSSQVIQPPAENMAATPRPPVTMVAPPLKAPEVKTSPPQTLTLLTEKQTPVSAQSLQATSDATFKYVLAYVYNHNPQINSQRAELEMLDERVDQANAGYRPTLSANGSIGQERVQVEGSNWTSGEDKNASLVATQPLFSGFGTQAQEKAADARVLAGRARLLATEQNVLLAAITAWLDVCEKENLLHLNRQQLSRMQTYEDAAKKRFEAGDGTRTDIAVAQSRLAETQARYAMAEAARNVALATYVRDVKAPAQMMYFPSLPQDLPANEARAVALVRDNPSLKEAAQLENATQHDVDAASSSLWPNVYLQGSMSQENSTPLGLDRLRDDSITLNVSIPLYEGGAEYSRIREAKIAHEKSRLDAIDLERNLHERASEAWDNYNAAQAVIAASDKTVSASQQMLSGIQAEHEQGTRTLTEVLDAQDALYNARTTEIQAQKNLRLEAYRLMASVGQLTAEDLQLPVTPYDPATHYNNVATRWAGTASRDQIVKPAGWQQ